MPARQHLRPPSEHPEVALKVPGERPAAWRGAAVLSALGCRLGWLHLPIRAAGLSGRRGSSPGNAARLKGASSQTPHYLSSLLSAGAELAQCSYEAEVHEVNVFAVTS